MSDEPVTDKGGHMEVGQGMPVRDHGSYASFHVPSQADIQGKWFCCSCCAVLGLIFAFIIELINLARAVVLLLCVFMSDFHYLLYAKLAG